MTGEELSAIRKAAGLSQTDLARRAGIGRYAVSYWECKPEVNRRSSAMRAIAAVLLLQPSNDEASADAVCIRRVARLQALRMAEEAAVREQMGGIQAVLSDIPASSSVPCGAKTRKGTPCRCKSEPGKKRCRFHGGMSTGARTLEGKERIAQAQRLRWERWRTATRCKGDPDKC